MFSAGVGFSARVGVGVSVSGGASVWGGRCRSACAAAGVVGAGSGWVGWSGFVYTAPPTPTRNPPWRGGRFAPPCRRFAPGFALRARAAAGVVGAGSGWVGWSGFVYTAPPTPTRNPPWRGGRFAPPCRRFAPGFALRARAAAGVVGAGSGWVGWSGFVAPPRPPPPVILPGAAVALLRLAGALRRASPFGLALPPAVLGAVLASAAVPVSVSAIGRRGR